MKNSIWYRFSSEKDPYEIRFDTIEISIKDIKKEIISRRNMVTFPEKFDLKFYDEENPSIEKKEEERIKPMKHLIVRRLPNYLEKDFKSEIRDPSDIAMNKINEYGLKRGEMQQMMRYNEPLEKIILYINKEMLNKQFKCKICDKFEENIYNNPIITLCCKETFCLDCYNKNDKCPFCKNDKKGFVKNEAESNLINKLLEILNKKEEEAALQENLNKNNNLADGNDINQKNTDNKINSISNNLLSNTPGKTIGGINAVENPPSLYQLQKQLTEGCLYYIIKSNTLENIKKSKVNSVWATTTANSLRLNQAFSKGKVILIFSVNGSHFYYGYAIMTSYSAESPSNIWQIENNIKLAGDFSVSWLCYCELPFSKTQQLSINKSRDCTELESKIGNRLCELCYEQEKEELEKNPQRIKIDINETFIQKINDDINNNKNKQIKKKSNSNNTQINNEQNKINNNDTVMPQPAIPQYSHLYYFPYFYPFAQMQQKRPDGVNPMIMPGMMAQAQMQSQMQQIQQAQPKQEEDKKENKDNKEKKEHKKSSKYHKSRRRSRSKDKSRSRNRSRSRNKNKSRSSRSRKSSSSSRSEGRSKYSKSYK